MKAQNDRLKLKDSKTPEKLEKPVEVKFIRDKSEITKNLEKLTREISYKILIFRRRKFL